MVDVELPKGWSIQPLKNLCQIVMGQSPLSSTYNASHIGIPLIQGLADTADGLTTPKVWTSEPTKVVPASTTLMSVRAPVGAVVRSDTEVNLGRGMCGFLPHSIEIGNFLYHSLVFSEQAWSSTSQGSTFTAVNKANVEEFVIALPDEPREQQMIAEALSDIDELITFLKRELIKKINLRTAFTQRRLKFENAKKVKLGNYANFSKGSGLPKSQLTTNGKFKAIHYGELFLKYPESIRRVISRTDTSSNAIYSRVNDVLMPSSDVTPTGLAVASCIREDDVILGGDVLIIRPNSASELDGRYLSYVIRNSKQEILKLVRGTTVYHIYGKDMADFELFLPGIDEQIEIVESLDLQREEISLLEEELQKYEWLKQGMMNDLLTGKVRLV